MRTKLNLCVLLLWWLAASNLALAQSTAFTYQGRLNFNGAPVSGSYDFQFAIYDASAAGNLVTPPRSVNAVDVINGLFVARLAFGAGVFTGPARWLQVSFRTAGKGTFATMDQRLELTSSPYSIRALAAGVADSVSAGSVVKSLHGLHDDVTLAAGANVTLTPNGNTLTISASGGGGGGVWSLSGNNVYYNGGNVGIGTSSPQENLTIAGVASYNTGLKLTGNAAAGTGLALQNTGAGGHKYSLLSGGSSDGVGAGGFGLFDDTAAAYRLAIDTNGNVGIGVATPASRLDVVSGGGDIFHLTGYNPYITFRDTALGLFRNAPCAIQEAGGGLNLFNALYLDGQDSFSFLRLDWTGNVGIGSATPASKLEVVSQDALSMIGYQPFLTLKDSNAGYARSRIQGVGGELVFETEGFVSGASPNAWARLNGSGNMSVETLTIRGGADLAEPFELSTPQVAKGSVMVIDPDNPGRLKVSDQPYDCRVAGVVSGAGGINPGISLHQEGLIEGGENIALSGRVYVLADATDGAIQPGDLVTSSATPGHAMKVADHARAQGAILGKAMTGLKQGRGLVLVLVTLQ